MQDVKDQTEYIADRNRGIVSRRKAIARRPLTLRQPYHGGTRQGGDNNIQSERIVSGPHASAEWLQSSELRETWNQFSALRAQAGSELSKLQSEGGVHLTTLDKLYLRLRRSFVVCLLLLPWGMMLSVPLSIRHIWRHCHKGHSYEEWYHGEQKETRDILAGRRE
jgi:hypothetical protein